jgi:hypothetical protein
MKLHLTVVAAAMLMPLAACHQTGTTEKDRVSREKERIEAQYKSAKNACDARSGNAKDICETEAKGEERVALAELDARGKGTAEAREQAAIVRAKAVHAVALQRCDDPAGNPEDVCRKDAEAALTRAKADAKLAATTEEARGDAQSKIAEAQADASKTIRKTDYAAAKERCDSLAGSTKDDCIAKAKAAYGM